MLDLKGKLSGLLSITSQLDEVDSIDQKSATSLNEAQEALIALGYSEQEIRSIVPALRKDADGTTDEIIRKALALLMKN